MRGERRSKPSVEREETVYYISIVAEMVETHPQTLRMYERMGLLTPRRTRNNIRLYSEQDIATVRRIQHLTQELGVNLAGVEVVFKLLDEMERMRAELKSQPNSDQGQSVQRTENALALVKGSSIRRARTGT